jgi:YHS domain-containing protein
MKKTNQYILLAACALGVVALATKLPAADTAAPVCAMPGCTMTSCSSGMNLIAIADTNTNAIPDRLTTCPVSGDKLGTDMGPPYVFVYQGQEVKLCCSSCKKDFDKNPDKYLKLIRAADKK